MKNRSSIRWWEDHPSLPSTGHDPALSLSLTYLSLLTNLKQLKIKIKKERKKEHELIKTYHRETLEKKTDRTTQLIKGTIRIHKIEMRK